MLTQFTLLSVAERTGEAVPALLAIDLVQHAPAMDVVVEIGPNVAKVEISAN